MTKISDVSPKLHKISEHLHHLFKQFGYNNKELNLKLEFQEEIVVLILRYEESFIYNNKIHFKAYSSSNNSAEIIIEELKNQCEEYFMQILIP